MAALVALVWEADGDDDGGDVVVADVAVAVVVAGVAVVAELALGFAVGDQPELK